MDSNLIEIVKGFFVKSDTVFSVLTTLTVFVFGLLINGVIKAIIRYRKRRFNRTLVNLNLPKLIEILEKQIEEFKSFIKFLDIDCMTPVNYGAVVNPHIHILYGISYVELQKAYFSGIENIFVSGDSIRVDSFGKLWSRLTHLNMTYDNHKDEAIALIDRIQILQDERNVASRKPRVLIEKFLFSISGKQVDAAVLHIVNNTLINFDRFNGLGRIATPTEVKDYLESMLRLLSININVLIANKELFDFVELQDELKWSIYKYGNQFNVIDANKGSFENIIRIYGDYVTDLKYAQRHLK